MHRSTFLIMLHRSAVLRAYEFGEVVEFVLEDTLRKGNPVMIVIRCPVYLCPSHRLYSEFSVTCADGVVPNQISTELFWMYHFFMEFRDWKSHLDEYDDFCSNRL